jgi:hypothetical protein
MANCKRFGHKITNLCGTPAGVKEIYLANYSDLIDYRLDLNEVILSGITMNGEAILVSDPPPIYITKSWYKVSIPRETSLFLTEALINIPNGVSQSIPKLDFKVVGLDETILRFYDQVKQTTLITVCKTLDNQFYALGFQNGLDCVECSIGTTENRESGFKGATFVLKGMEKDPMYLLDPNGIGKCFPNCWGDCDILADYNISIEYLGGLPITYMNC